MTKNKIHVAKITIIKITDLQPQFVIKGLQAAIT